MLVWQNVQEQLSDEEVLQHTHAHYLPSTEMWVGQKVFKNSSVIRSYLCTNYLCSNNVFLFLSIGQEVNFRGVKVHLTALSADPAGATLRWPIQAAHLTVLSPTHTPWNKLSSHSHSLKQVVFPLTLPKTSCLLTPTPWNKLSSHSHSLKQVVFPLHTPWNKLSSKSHPLKQLMKCSSKSVPLPEPSIPNSFILSETVFLKYSHFLETSVPQSQSHSLNQVFKTHSYSLKQVFLKLSHTPWNKCSKLIHTLWNKCSSNSHIPWNKCSSNTVIFPETSVPQTQSHSQKQVFLKHSHIPWNMCSKLSHTPWNKCSSK